MQIDRRALGLGLAATVAAAPRASMARQANFDAAKAYSTDRRGVSLLVIRDGRTVLEDYADGGSPERAWELASGTKSFCGVLAAAMVQDAMLRLDERCADTLPEWRDDPTKAVATIHTLLTLTSGIGAGRSGRPPTYAAAVTAPAIAPPRAVFRYSPTPFQVFGEIVRRKLVAAGRPGDVHAFLSERLLHPIGVQVGSWRRQEGQPNLPSGASLTARDWARFGAFVMRGGTVDGRAVVDTATLEACFQGTEINPGYGLTWWLLRPGLIAPGPRSGLDDEGPAPAGLPDVRMAAGAGYQRLYLVPERRLIIVRQASGILAGMSDRRGTWSDAAFLRLLLD